MPKYGLQLKINVVFLVFITTFITRIFSSDDHDSLKNQRYDYIDVAKATAGSRNKGQTTRILTTDDELDEKFWLKYLGEDFRKVVHLHVDNQNNVIPLIDITPPTPPPPPPPPPAPLPVASIFKHNENADKRTRFARFAPIQEENDEHLPVENLNQDPTDKPETNTTTTTMATPLPLANENHRTYSTHQQQQQQTMNNKKPSKHKDKLHPSNRNDKKKFVKAEKPWRSHNNMKKPLVANRPAADSSPAPLKAAHDVPVVMQIPPVVYHQKTDSKSNREFFIDENQLYPEQFPNLYLE